MLKKRKLKSIRGARKIRFRELPWISYLKCFSLILVIGILGYQFFSLRYHANKLSQTQQINSELTRKVSTLNLSLKEERISMESTLADQSNNLIQMKEQIEKMNGEVSKTLTDNKELITQINNVRTQNDILRHKLETLLGGASRSGTTLSPSPTGQSGLTITELKKLTYGTSLEGIEPTLLKIEKDYNCNALFALSVAKVESGCGASLLGRTKNNLFGIRTKTDWRSFKSKSDCILYFGNMMKKNYFSKGFTTLERIGPRYAEGSTTWAVHTKDYMITDMRKVITNHK